MSCGVRFARGCIYSGNNARIGRIRGEDFDNFRFVVSFLRQLRARVQCTWVRWRRLERVGSLCYVLVLAYSCSGDLFL